MPPDYHFFIYSHGALGAQFSACLPWIAYKQWLTANGSNKEAKTINDLDMVDKYISIGYMRYKMIVN